jgi:hypothetical protein
MMTPPKRTGRPPLDETDGSVGVHLRLSSKQFDDACRRAQAERLTVPEFFRRLLVPKVDKRI